MSEEIVIFSRIGAKGSLIAPVDKSQNERVKSLHKQDIAGRQLSIQQQKALAAYLSGNL